MVRTRSPLPPSPRAAHGARRDRRPDQRNRRRRVASAAPGLETRFLAFPARSLVVVGGMPGAGKTTLLERLGAVRGAVVLDSAAATRRWKRLPLPYRMLRPLVHLEHHANIVLTVLCAGRNGVVVHVTANRPTSRRWLLGLARLARRPAHLLMLDVDPAEARAGQLSRGRTVPARSQRRHAQRWPALRDELALGGVPGEDWTSVRLLDRAGADALAAVRVAPPVAARLLRVPRVAD